MNWFVYIVECSDKSLYTGISPDVEKRVNTHNKGLGAKSIKGKLPVRLVYTERHKNRELAAKREYNIKSWSREYKLKLIERGRVYPKN